MSDLKVWSIGSGKGGVGKSFVASSLGLTLAKTGHKTLLVDLDLSGPNLHTALGEKPKPKNLDLFFNHKEPVSQIISPTKFPNLSYVQGTSFPGERELPELRKFVDQVRLLPYQYVLFDLGPGSQDMHLELLSQSDEKVFVMTPEPSCIEKNYRMIENFIVYNLVKQGNKLTRVKVKESIELFKAEPKPNPKKLREFLAELIGQTWDNERPFGLSPVRLLVNQARVDNDVALGHSVGLICHHYFGLKTSICGPLNYDNAVWQSYRDSEPMLYKNPFSPLAGQFLNLSRELMKSELSAFPFKAVL